MVTFLIYQHDFVIPFDFSIINMNSKNDGKTDYILPTYMDLWEIQ